MSSNQRKTYLYQLYGLSLRTDLPLPELMPLTSCEVVDIHIKAAQVSSAGLAPFKVGDGLLCGRPGKLYLRFPDVGAFRIEDGKTISYQIDKGFSSDMFRLVLLGSCMGSLLMQRGLLVLHGNAIEVDGKTVLCLGHTGAGKSTTAIAMHQRGHALLSDDISPITPDKQIWPGVPRAKLLQDTAAALSIDVQGLRLIRADQTKYDLPFTITNPGFARFLDAIFILNPTDMNSAQIDTIPNAQKPIVLRKHSYRYAYVECMDHEAEHFKLTASVGANLPMFAIQRPTQVFDIEHVCAMIENTVDQL